MAETDLATVLFFEEHRDALDLYLTLENRLTTSFPDVTRSVQKTQITFRNPRVCACVSFARVRRKAELPPGWLVLTLGLPSPLPSPRVAVSVEVRPGRWTHHIVLSTPEELDSELMDWVQTSYAFAQKHLRSGSSRRP